MPNPFNAQSVEISSEALKVPHPETCVGPTPELSLRVSGACLTLTLMQAPESGTELALFERVVRCSAGGEVRHQLQPVGGGVTVLNPSGFSECCGRFRFDSIDSARERDLRIYINPLSWPALRACCRAAFEDGAERLIETSPYRELQEEVGEPLGEAIRRTQYAQRFIGCIFQDSPHESGRGAAGPTVRVFAVHELRILDQGLAAKIIEACHGADLGAEIARACSAENRKSVALVALPLAEVTAALAAVPRDERDKRIPLGANFLADNVYAVVAHRLPPPSKKVV